MNKTLAAKFLSYGNLAQFFSSNASVWDDFPILKEEVSDFFTRKLQLENSTQSASNGLQGLSNAKLAQLFIVRTLCLKLCDKAYVWAKKTTNHVALATFDLTHSEFNKSQMDQIMMAKNLLALLKQHADALLPYKVTKEHLDGLEAAIAVAQVNLPTTSVAQKGKKVVNQSLPELFALVDDTVESIEKLFKSEYGDTHQDLVKEFILAKTIERPAVRHTTLRGKISDAVTAKDLSGAHCDLLEVEGEESLSDITGFYEISEFKAGTLSFEVSKEGYETFSQVLTIKRGQTKELNIALKPMAV